MQWLSKIGFEQVVSNSLASPRFSSTFLNCSCREEDCWNICLCLNNVTLILMTNFSSKLLKHLHKHLYRKLTFDSLYLKTVPQCSIDKGAGITNQRLGLKSQLQSTSIERVRFRQFSLCLAVPLNSSELD